MEQTHKQNNVKNLKETHISEEDTKVHFRVHFIIYFNHSFCGAFPAYPGDNFHNKIRRVKHNLFFWGWW